MRAIIRIMFFILKSSVAKQNCTHNLILPVASSFLLGTPGLLMNLCFCHSLNLRSCVSDETSEQEKKYHKISKDFVLTWP